MFGAADAGADKGCAYARAQPGLCDTQSLRFAGHCLAGNLGQAFVISVLWAGGRQSIRDSIRGRGAEQEQLLSISVPVDVGDSICSTPRMERVPGIIVLCFHSACAILWHPVAPRCDVAMGCGY